MNEGKQAGPGRARSGQVKAGRGRAGQGTARRAPAWEACSRIHPPFSKLYSSTPTTTLPAGRQATCGHACSAVGRAGELTEVVRITKEGIHNAHAMVQDPVPRRPAARAVTLTPCQDSAAHAPRLACRTRMGSGSLLSGARRPAASGCRAMVSFAQPGQLSTTTTARLALALAQRPCGAPERRCSY